METAITLLHSPPSKKNEHLENYYIQFFHQHIIIKEKTQKKNPLFKLTYNIHVHQAST